MYHAIPRSLALNAGVPAVAHTVIRGEFWSRDSTCWANAKVAQVPLMSLHAVNTYSICAHAYCLEANGLPHSICENQLPATISGGSDLKNSAFQVPSFPCSQSLPQQSGTLDDISCAVTDHTLLFSQ